MSAGHRFNAHPIRAEQKTDALALLHEPRFRKALRNYTKENGSHRIVFLAGSDTEGRTVFFDKDLPAKLKINRRGGRAEMVDPRQFLWWHEAAEGVLIRDYGFGYYKAHLYATAIERSKVEAADYDWNSYQRALKPCIRADEDDSAAGTPKNLLTDAYKHSRWWPEIQRATAA